MSCIIKLKPFKSPNNFGVKIAAQKNLKNKNPLNFFFGYFFFEKKKKII